ncbi:MAG: hypothetical protein ACR2OZ_00255 [Verrucomicrobiales bacterium]
MNSTFAFITSRRFAGWILRLVLGMALGFGGRILWELKPAVRFATGLAWKATTGALAQENAATRSSVPTSNKSRFSLDALAASEDPARTLRAWRQELEALPAAQQVEWLNQVIETSAAGLRKFLGRLAIDGALRDEFLEWRNVIERVFIESDSRKVVANAFRELARLDLGLALDGAEASEFPEAMEAVFEVLAEDDPKAALVVAKERNLSPQIVAIALESLAARSLAETEPWMEQFASDEAMEGFARVMAAKAPAQAFEFCRDENGRLDGTALEILAGQVPAHRAGEFLRSLESLDPSSANTHPRAAGRLAQMMARLEPAEAIQWVQQHWPDAQNTALSHKIEVLRIAGEREPQMAAEALAGISVESGKSLRGQAFSSTMQIWVARDPEAALEWSLNQPFSQSADPGFVADWFERLPATQFESTAELLNNVPNDKLRVQLQSALRSSWIQHDPAAVFARDDAQRLEFRSGAFSRWFAVDPTAALEVAATLSPAERTYAVVSENFADPGLTPFIAKVLDQPLAEVPSFNAPFVARLLWAQIEHGNRGVAMTALENLPESVRGAVAHSLCRSLCWNFPAHESELAWKALNHVTDPVERLPLESLLLRRQWGLPPSVSAR